MAQRVAYTKKGVRVVELETADGVIRTRADSGRNSDLEKSAPSTSKLLASLLPDLRIGDSGSSRA